MTTPAGPAAPPTAPGGARLGALPPGGLVALLERMAQAGDGARVNIAEINRAIGAGGLGGALLVPALIALSPASAVFGVATLCGLSIAAIAAQIMCDARRLWLPGWLGRVEVRREALLWLSARLRGPFAWIERRSRPRMQGLMRRPLGHLPGAATFVTGVTMPFLELVPMSATTAGAAVTLMVLGLLLGDGLLVAAGLVAALGVWLLAATLGSGVAVLLGAVL